MKLLCIQRTLSRQYGKLGTSIARYPKTYIISSFFFSILCGTGLQNLKETSNITNKFEFDNGISVVNKHRLETLFPTNFSSFDPSRAITEGHYAIAIVVAKDGGSILSQYIIEQILLVDKIINEIFFEWDEKRWTYRDICSKKEGYCYQNKILSLLDDFQYSEGIVLKYPLKINATRHMIQYDTLALGGVILDENNHVLSARAVKLMYFVDGSTKTRKIRSKLWEKLFLRLSFEELEHISVEKFCTISINEEILGSGQKSLPFVPTLCIVMSLFAVLSCCTTDCVRSKPWLGILTEVSSMLSLMSGFGALLYLHLEMVVMNSVAPFIILGIGMDDTFVMLAAWHQTDPKKPVEKRMAEMFTDAGVSITITSLTNFVAFLSGGLIGSLPSIRPFCLYMAACLAFDFIYQLTFVGGFMAVFGKIEEQGRHSFTFHRVKLSKKDGDHGCFERVIGVKLNILTKESKFDIRNINFWSIFADLLTIPLVKSFTVIAYLAYFSWCTWSATTIQQKMEMKNFVFYDSYIQRYLDANDRYYYQYNHRLQIVVDKPLDYSKPSVQKNIEKMMQLFESDDLIAGSFLTESWLRSYLNYTSNDQVAFLFSNYNFSNNEDFIHVLKRFFRLPLARRFENDVLFNDNSTEIRACRFFLQTNITRDFSEFQQKLLLFMKKTENESPYPIIIYHPSLAFMELIEATTFSALTTLACIIVITVVICSLFFTSLICSLCVTFSIFSVFVGILGCMEPWGMHMNISSATCMIVVSGLAVDYTAHISYAYAISCKDNANDRMRFAVATFGGPVVHGGVSTILSIVAMIHPPSYNHAIFVKLLFLATTISIVHAVIVIPVALSLFEPVGNRVWNALCSWWNFRRQHKFDDTRRLSRSTVSVNSFVNHSLPVTAIYCVDDVPKIQINNV